MPVVIESVLKLYSNKLKAKDISVLREYCDCQSAMGVSGELKQVVSNLVSNAIDAINEGGSIRVGTWCTEGPRGKMMHMLVEDDGPGVPLYVRDRIFEPFFTTKDDIGTGLGLWVAREIVTRHGGSIELKARDDGRSGASFSVLLPCSVGPAPASNPPS